MSVFNICLALSSCRARWIQVTITRNTMIKSGMAKTAGLAPESMSRRESFGRDASKADHMGESKTRFVNVGAIVDDR